MHQSVQRACYCGVRTFALKMHYGSEKLGQSRKRSCRILIRNELVLTFRAPNNCATFHKNLLKIVTLGAWTERQTDACDFVMCPMLCFSSGTSNYYNFC